MREGYEPNDEVAIADDPMEEENNQFRVGDDEDDNSKDSEESKQWKQSEPDEPAVLLKPKYGLDGEAFENVWGSADSSSPAPENP